jgi:signal recognition particle subunit SRP54
MGDVLSLIEKSQELVDEEEAAILASRLEKGDFTLEDFRDQMGKLKKMGSIDSIIGMIPGLGKLKKLKDAKPDPKDMSKIEAIINSMTINERRNYQIIDASRRRRIANGSGTSINEVNLMLRNFAETQKMLRQFSRGGLGALARKLF